MDFPLLFSFKNNKFHTWSIKATLENEIVRTYGQEHGTQTVSVHKVFKKNKNTHYQQACADAMSMFRKQKVIEGYSEYRSKEITGVLSPMRSHVFENSHRIKYPAFVQPKLFDGVRMLTTFDNGEFLFVNRSLRTGLRTFFKTFFETNLAFLKSNSTLWLDGEFCSSTLTFEEITNIVFNSTGPEKLFDTLEYHVYDIVPADNSSVAFHERHETLRHLSQQFPDKIKWVPTYEVQNADEVTRHHNEFVQQGYDGVMVRNRDGPYVHGRRSYDLQTYKNFRDEEFVIADINDDTGFLQCKTNDGSRFWVRPRGNLLLRDHKRVTVRYQHLTDKNIPRFPVGIR
jgi:DNA ligase-1